MALWLPFSKIKSSYFIYSICCKSYHTFNLKTILLFHFPFTSSWQLKSSSVNNPTHASNPTTNCRVFDRFCIYLQRPHNRSVWIAVGGPASQPQLSHRLTHSITQQLTHAGIAISNRQGWSTLTLTHRLPLQYVCAMDRSPHRRLIFYRLGISRQEIELLYRVLWEEDIGEVVIFHVLAILIQLKCNQIEVCVKLFTTTGVLTSFVYSQKQ